MNVIGGGVAPFMPTPVVDVSTFIVCPTAVTTELSANVICADALLSSFISKSPIIAVPVNGLSGDAPRVIVAAPLPMDAGERITDNATGDALCGVKLSISTIDGSYVRCISAAETDEPFVSRAIPKLSVCPADPVTVAGWIVSVGPVSPACLRSSIRWVNTAHIKTGSATRRQIRKNHRKNVARCVVTNA